MGGGGEQLTQCRKKTRRNDEECVFFPFILKDAVLLHFAVTSSVIAPVEGGGGRGYAGGVGCLSLYSSQILSKCLSVTWCLALRRTFAFADLRRNFTPTLIFTL